MMRKFSLVAAALVLTTSVFAGTKANISAQKPVNLVDEDAKKWTETFGDSFKGNRNFNFKCQDEKCDLTVAVRSLKGPLAKQLLKGRDTVEYKNQDNSFSIQCNKGPKASYNCTITRTEPSAAVS